MDGDGVDVDVGVEDGVEDGGGVDDGDRRRRR